ncbi:MAG: asparagine synthase (glutamine-hydrolyzing) [Planctomycetota bacterium]|jgi:asparagine synthase (glutamine-hydrolysing)
MCGIAGVIAPKEREDASSRDVRRMCGQLAKRGPDGIHQERYNGVVLGHARLAIIDLETGDQPQGNEDGSVKVVVNGEIYNYVELRQDLVNRGHKFRTQSDIEVIPHLYDEYGDDFVDHLRGMFAIALWDMRERRLLLVRDRLGKKPLYYIEHEDRFYFASELKSLLQVEDIELTTDLEALEDFFTFQYIPSPKTAYKEIRKIPAATMLVWKDGRREFRKYWEPSLEINHSITEDEALEQLEEIFDEAVRLRLRSDVPLGAFLSSGIDSTLVVASMAGLVDTPLRTTTIAFDDANNDEVRLAESVAKQFGTNHQTKLIQADVRDTLEKVSAYLDEPLGDSSTLPSFLVSRAARDDVKVAISGDGGDESFGGYAWRYSQNIMLDTWRRRLPGAFGRKAVGLAAFLYPKLDRMPRPFRLKWGLRNLSVSAEEAYFLDMSVFRPEIKKELYRSEFVKGLHGYSAKSVFMDKFAETEGHDLLTRILKLDLSTYLADGVLAKVDRMSMANSLEVRSPLLDHKVVEFAFSLPTSFKMEGKVGKKILRRMSARRVGDEVARAPKSGFAPPLAGWLRNELADVFRDLVLDNSHGVHLLLESSKIRRMYEEHVSKKFNHARPLWLILSFEMWFRSFGTRARLL